MSRLREGAFFAGLAGIMGFGSCAVKPKDLRQYMSDKQKLYSLLELGSGDIAIWRYADYNRDGKLESGEIQFLVDPHLKNLGSKIFFAAKRAVGEEKLNFRNYANLSIEDICLMYYPPKSMTSGVLSEKARLKIEIYSPNGLVWSGGATSCLPGDMSMSNSQIDSLAKSTGAEIGNGVYAYTGDGKFFGGGGTRIEGLREAVEKVPGTYIVVIKTPYGDSVSRTVEFRSKKN